MIIILNSGKQIFVVDPIGKHLMDLISKPYPKAFQAIDDENGKFLLCVNLTQIAAIIPDAKVEYFEDWDDCCV